MRCVEVGGGKKEMMGEIGVGGENFENNGVKMGKWFVDYDS